MTIQNITVGQAQLNAGNTPAARKVAEAILEQNPLDVQALDLLHDCLIAEKEYIAAKSMVLKWLEQQPQSRNAHQALLTTQLHLDDKKGCLKTFETFKESFPQAVTYIKMMDGILDTRFGNGKRGLKIFTEMREEHPEIGTFVFLQGQVAYNQDRLFAAFKLFRQALALNPEDAAVWRMYAFTAYHLLRYGTARKAARKALELDPTVTGLKEITLFSYIVYFPLFYIASALGSSYFIFSELFGKTAAFFGSLLAGYFLFGPILIKATRALENVLEIQISLYWMIGPILLWVVIEQIMFQFVDRVKKPKTKTVKLSDY